MESDILRTQDQDNEKCLLQKYRNLRFLDNEGNQNCMVAPENLEFKGFTIRNKRCCVIGKPLDWRDGDNVYLLISRDINDYFMVLIKGV